MNYSLGFAKNGESLNYALGAITRDQKIFKLSAEELSACVDTVIRTLIKEQPDLFDKLGSFDWSTVEAVANTDGTIAICDKDNHDIVRLRLPEALTLQALRDMDAQLSELINANSDSIANIVSGKPLSSAGYNGTSDLGKIPVVNGDGNLAVRRVHFLIDDEEDGGSLVLRGAVGQVIASIELSELKEAIGTGGGSVTGATQEQAKQIEQNKTDIAALQETISGVADALDAI